MKGSLCMIEFLLCCNKLCFTISQGAVFLSAQGTCITCYSGLRWWAWCANCEVWTYYALYWLLLALMLEKGCLHVIISFSSFPCEKFPHFPFLWFLFLFLSLSFFFQTQSLTCYFVTIVSNPWYVLKLGYELPAKRALLDARIAHKLYIATFYCLVKHCLAGTIYFCVGKRSRIWTNHLIGGFLHHVVHITVRSLPKGQYYVPIVKSY